MRARLAVLSALAGMLLPLWAAPQAEAASAVQIYKVYYNSPGTDDRSNTSLNAEYVTLKNTGTSTANLYGWTLRDVTGYVYTFSGTFYLKPGYTVTVHTGKGTNTATQRYWGRSAYVWNNTGDTAYLRNSTGTPIDSCSWGSSGSYKYC